MNERMNIDDKTTIIPDISDEDFIKTIADFVENGKTLSDIKGISHDHLEAVYGVAHNVYSSGDYQQAQKIFQFLCYCDHLEKKYWMGLGACRQMLKLYVEAVETYSFAMLLDSSDPQPPLLAADCHIALGNKEEAISGLNAAIEWSGDNPKYQELRERAQALLEVLSHIDPASNNLGV